MRTLIGLTILIALPTFAVAQSAPIAFTKPGDAFVQGLDAVCKPWLAGEDRKAMTKRLVDAGWTTLESVIFTANGAWGDALFTAGEPKDGRDCSAFILIKEKPWSTSAVREAADRWAEANIGGAKQSATVTIFGKPENAWAWVRADGVITRLVEFREPQTTGGDVLLRISPPVKPAPPPPPSAP